MTANLPLTGRFFDESYTFSPSNDQAFDDTSFNALLDAAPANRSTFIRIRDNGKPLKLGTPGAAARTKSITGKSIFIAGEHPGGQCRIVWGVGTGTGTNGLYTLNWGGFASPLSFNDTMPSFITRAAMGGAGIGARASKVPSPNLALARGDRILVWADNEITDVGPHHKGGSQRPGELHRVEWASGTDYTLDTYVHDAMTTNPRIAKITMMPNCGMANLAFGYEGSASRAVQYNFIDIRYTYKFRFENIFVDNTGAGTLITHCNDQMRISGYDVEHMPYASEYAILDRVNRDLLIEDVRTRFCRHLYTTGGIPDATKQWTLDISATGGTYTLTMNGNVTSSLAYNASAASVQTALQALANVGSGNCTVTAWPSGNFLTISMAGSRLTQSNTLSVATGSLTGGSATLTASVARYGNNRNTTLLNCKSTMGGTAAGAVQYGYSTHAEGIDTEYHNCTAELGAADNGSSGSVGFTLRSRNERFFDCKVMGNAAYTTAVRNLHTGWQQVGGSGGEWHRCRVDHAWIGIDFAGDFYGKNQDNFLISDCIFERCTGNAVRSAANDTGFGTVDNIRIHDSLFRNGGASVGSSTQGAHIRITKGSGHKIRGCHLDLDLNRYSVSFEALTSSNVEMLGNYCRGYGAFGSNKMGIRGQAGDPYAVSEATADGFQTAYGALNYTTA